MNLKCYWLQKLCSLVNENNHKQRIPASKFQIFTGEHVPKTPLVDMGLKAPFFVTAAWSTPAAGCKK